MYDTLAQLGDTNEISVRDSCGGSSKDSVNNKMMKFVNASIDIFPTDKVSSETQTVQTETRLEVTLDFLAYKCFYCDQTIKSKQELIDHRGICNGEKVDENLQKQVTALTVFQTLMSRALQKPKLPCDRCGETFESEELLKLHKMFTCNPDHIITW